LGIATALSQAGVKVMLCDIEEKALAKAVADLKLTNADVDSVRADVSLKAELQAAADATVARYGKIHILVNNAGVGGGGGYGRWDAFLTAIAIAQQQKARSFELRAALSLAKPYQSTDRAADAHAVLASALMGFSPTPEFPEIAEAQTLLSALAP
jgi:NAD(P)-dependent dehydrogenase (short-subunit alcohol dehydrogenase family)